MFRRSWPILVLPLVAALAGCPSNSPSSPSGNSTSNPTPTFTAATATATNSPTVTVSRTPTSSPTLTATSTPPITPTSTPTGTVTRTPTDSPTGTVTDTPTDTATSTPTPPCQIGVAPAIAGDVNTGGLYAYLFRYQAPSTGFIYSMTSEMACPVGSDYFQYGVYADDGSGNPTNLIGSTPVTTFTTAATAFTFETISFSSPIPITGGDYYWLAFRGNVAIYDDNSTTDQYDSFLTSAGPTPMPSGPVSSIVSVSSGQPFFYLYGTTCP